MPVLSNPIRHTSESETCSSLLKKEYSILPSMVVGENELSRSRLIIARESRNERQKHPEGPRTSEDPVYVDDRREPTRLSELR